MENKTWNVKRIIILGITFLLSAFCAFSLFAYVKLSVIWFVLFFGLVFFRYRFNSKSIFIADIVFPLFSGFFVSYFSIFVLFAEDVKDSSSISLIGYLSGYNIWGRIPEFCFTIISYFILRLFIKDRRLAVSLAPSIPMLVGLLDSYVFIFRGSEINAGDITAIKTAINVASSYDFFIVLPIAGLILPYVLFVLAAYSFEGLEKESSSKDRKTVFVIVAIIAFICGGAYLLNVLSKEQVLLWKNEGSKYHGFVANLLLSAKSLNIETPEGYSADEIGEINRVIVDNENNTYPNIIIIMNESFTDITKYNEFYDDSYEDPLPYFHSLANDTEHAYVGYAMSSVYGGGTSISEFEVLTGISSAFLPANVSPYVLYINEDTYSIPWELLNLGYSTVAMHPYYSNGWSRSKVYPYIGFEETYFIDDFVYDDSDMIRDYISDVCAYRNMISVIEEKKNESDQPVFAFLITMQNHGGYDASSVTNFEYESYFPGFENESLFASLLNESDFALQMLLDYLSTQDEEYIVLMFGDHHPSISSFNDQFDLEGLASVVPYVIWDNYGLDSSVAERLSLSEFSSLNYLGLTTLEAANLPLSTYFQYIEDVREVIPCINSIGYYNRSTDSFLAISNYDVSTSEGHAIQLYRYLQYYSLFDDQMLYDFGE